MLGGRLEGRCEDQVSGGEDIAKIYSQFLNQVMFKMGVELKMVGRVPVIMLRLGRASHHICKLFLRGLSILSAS